MKLFPKLMIALLVLALLLPFTILKDDSGNTLMSFSDFRLPEFSLPGLPQLSGKKNSAKAIDGVEGLVGKDIFYQWHDADGNLQFTTEPPPEGIEYTIKGYDPNTNVIQAVKLPDERDDGDAGQAASGEAAEPEDIGNPYDPDAIGKLFKDTRNIEKMLKQRLQQQQEALFN